MILVVLSIPAHPANHRLREQLHEPAQETYDILYDDIVYDTILEQSIMYTIYDNIAYYSIIL